MDQVSMNHKELLKGNTETLLLSLLAEEPMYGYQIVKVMEKRSRGYFQFKEGTLYPALHRLEESKLVKGRWGDTAAGAPRKYYHITAKGQKVLSDSLQEWQLFSMAVNSVTLPEFPSRGAIKVV